MFPSYLLALREGIEAALIIGVVLSALRKTGQAALVSAVWWGVGSAALVGAGAAFLLTRWGLTLEGHASAAFEGATMFAAAGILTWMLFWMKGHAADLQRTVTQRVAAAAGQGSARALYGLAFFAVLREGLELALFLSAAAFTSTAAQTASGALLGLATAALLGWALFTATLRLNLRRFFQVTTVLLFLFAAGLIANGVHEWNEIGWIPAGVEHLWNTAGLLRDASPLGSVLTALFGYRASPSLSAVLAYGGYMATVAAALRLTRRPPAHPDAA